MNGRETLDTTHGNYQVRFEVFMETTSFNFKLDSTVLHRKPLTLNLPEINMETPKGPYKDHSPFKRGLYGFPC